jgi:hypothetical protein
MSSRNEKPRRKPQTRRPEPRPAWRDSRMAAANDDTYDEEPAPPKAVRPRAARRTA